ncbi:MAG: hypothetical protein IPL84_05255 [Chitinophagaceae bacterium]|nr:hypothetical protein [Chitinophagaceae bacterium]
MLKKITAEKDDNRRFDIIYNALVKIGETDPLLGLQYAQKLLEYAQNKKDKISEAYALSFMSKMYTVSGNLEKGLKYGLQGKELAEHTGNQKMIALSYSLLGLNYKNLSDFPKALSLYKSDALIAEKANFYQAQSWSYQNLSDVYMATNQVDSALKYAQKDYEITQLYKYYDFISYTLANLGVIHERSGNPAVALGYFDMAINESLKARSPRQLSQAYMAKAEFFHARHQKDSAIMYAKKAIEAVQNTDYLSNSIKPAELLLDMYRGNNIDSAFKYSELYRITNDSVFNTKAIQQTQLMRFEDELQQQRSADEKIKADEQRKHNIQYALIAFGIISFVIIFLLLSRSIITNTKIIEFLGILALLVVFEFLNLLLHPFLESVTNHSPFLMLSALVCIAALLIPLHHKAEKWATAKLVEKNKQIRLAAAKKTIEKLGDG